MDYNKYESHAGLGSRLLPFIHRRDYVAKNSAFVPHWHENTEILHCKKGGGTVLINGISYNFSIGTTIVVNPNNIHIISSEDFIEYDCLIIFDTYLKENGIETKKLTFTPIIKNNEITELLKKINSDFSKKESINPIKTRLDVLTLLFKLYDEFSNENLLNSEASLKGIKSGIEFIHRNFNQNITLNDAANASNLSKYYFTKKFKQITGTTFCEFLNVLRCDNASKLISEGKSVNEACFLSGFNDAAYFSRIFKKINGFPPSKLLKSKK